MWKDYFRSRRRRFQNYVRQDPSSRAKLIAKITKIVFILVIIGIVLTLISIPIVARSLPSPDKVVRREGFSTKIIDRKGQVLYDVFSEKLLKGVL